MTVPLQVYCELGPVLVNRTAVFRICKDLPAALTQRGISVAPFALLGKLDGRGEPASRLARLWLNLSRRMLLSAIRRPEIFLKARRLLHLCLSWKRGARLPLILDPLYLLFHPEPHAGVVVVYDTTPVTEPHWHPRGVAKLYEAAFASLARSGCHVVAASLNTAEHLRVNHGIAPSRLTVLPLGLFPTADVPDAPVAPHEPFLLFVGNLEPRKNINGLLAAYRQGNFYPAHGVRLRIIGQICEPEDPVLVSARATPGVDLLGFVSAEELSASYRDCLGFVYPSLCEGFGLPLLEAMHRGCVCLATLAGASPEVGGDAVLYVDPYSVDDIVRGMLRLIELSSSARSDLAQRARARSSRFTWDSFHDGLATVLQAEAIRAAQPTPRPLPQPAWLAS
jgi:alpha-1,3-rhamnosyl/mannosyltransferase